MGLTVCKHYCRCCPCGCCHDPVQNPDIGEDNMMATPISNTKVPGMKNSMVFQATAYRTHPPNLELVNNLENQLKGEDNVGFTDISISQSIDGGLEQGKIQLEQNTGRDVILAQAKRRSNRLEILRRTQISTCSYKPRSAEDLEVCKGDELEVLEEKGTWILARTLNSGEDSKTGYIPRTFLANAGSLEAEDWYFNLLTKMDAKRYLMQEENGTGSFLVWQKKDDECYYLSVREDSVVRNYRIHELDGSFFLVERALFANIKELIKYYMDTGDGLHAKLDKPCVKLDLPPVDSISHKTVNQLEIDPTSIIKVRKLGRGKFGLVWLGLWNGTTEVAIKELQVTAESLQKSLKGEAETMWRLSHERVLKLYAVCLQTQPVFIVTEYMKHGTLKKYLRGHQEFQDLEFYLLVDFAVQIAQGMAYMEQKGYVHRDLRSENILLSAMMSCKIGDFGLARFVENSSILVSADAQIPIKWTAPEVFQHQKYSIKSDVWSFGVLLGEIMTYGKLPFPDKTNGDYSQDIMEKKRLNPPAECPSTISHIMEMCWRHQPATRPSFAEIEGLLMDLINPILVDDIVE